MSIWDCLQGMVWAKVTSSYPSMKLQIQGKSRRIWEDTATVKVSNRQGMNARRRAIHNSRDKASGSSANPARSNTTIMANSLQREEEIKLYLK